jgi:uncharacterized membrane protein
MTDANLVLCVATYPDAASAGQDYDALKAAEKDLDFAVVGAVVMSRDAEGKVSVDEHRAASPVAGSAVLGGGVGLVVGLFAPPLLAATVVGAGVGAGIGALVKKHQEKEMGVELEAYLPPGSSAVVAIVDDVYADRVDKALDHAEKRVSKAIDSNDMAQLQKALDEAATEVTKAADS